MSLHAYVYRALIDTRQLCHKKKNHALRANHCMIAAAVMQEDKK